MLGGLLARALRLGALQPVRPQGGVAGIRLEAGRIAALARAGLVVPEVLARGEDWLVLADLGRTTLEYRLRDATPAERVALWREGADYLVAAHQAGEHLSQAFSRNFVWSEHGLGAIDFEDHAGTAMSLPAAQARDWVMYLFSTANYFSDRLPELAALLEEALKGEAPGVADVLRATFRRTAWVRVVRRLPPRLQGLDVRKAWRYGELARLASA